MKSKDTFRQAVKTLCKVHGISPRKPSFETLDGFVIISVKNHSKDGVDLECFHILNLIIQLIAPHGTAFNQQLYLYPNSKRVAKVTVTFREAGYEALNRRLDSGI